MNFIGIRMGSQSCRCDRCSGMSGRDYDTLWGVVELIWSRREHEDCLDVDFGQLDDIWSCSSEAKQLAFNLALGTVDDTARFIQGIYDNRLADDWYANHGMAEVAGEPAKLLTKRLRHYLEQNKLKVTGNSGKCCYFEDVNCKEDAN